ncbi:MAG TPA: hypothetical protein VFU02_23965 [Polyangiaceae bacterium]|nr:hypothetical protein [Polyangiaceae bacterium]
MGLVERVTHILGMLRAALTGVIEPLGTRLARALQPVWAPIARSGRRTWELTLHPRTQWTLHVVSGVTVLASLAAYGVVWVEFNQPMLVNPDLQSDDARTILIPFHRYASDPALGDDPIANEMLDLVPLGVHALYRVLVPFTDVFVAPKIVQALAFALVLVAGTVLWRSRRAGLGAGVLLVFFLFHDWFAVERISGGLPRAFGFPCFALWLAGVLAHNRWARFGAPVISALSYPTVMLLILAAEGLYALRGMGSSSARVVWRRLRRYAAICVACLLAALPAALGSSDGGPVHTLEQAQLEPAFGKSGRLWILPFAEPSKVFLETYIDQLVPRGESPIAAVREAYSGNAEVWATTFFACLLLVGLLRLGPSPTVALAFTAGAVILYLLSRVLAFSLYSPERYYSFGMRMAAMALLISVPARLFPALRRRPRAILTNFVAALVLVLVWATAGHGQKAPSGMFVNANDERPLHDFVRTLPKHARFASHPMDGDGIPYFGARATMGTFETLQPWFVDSWRRQKDRCHATLRAMYATKKSDVLAYAKEHGVTHFLINQQRYRTNFAAKSASFQPFTTYARHLVSGHERHDFVMANAPKSAIVFQTNKWQVVDVERLRQAWR